MGSSTWLTVAQLGSSILFRAKILEDGSFLLEVQAKCVGSLRIILNYPASSSDSPLTAPTSKSFVSVCMHVADKSWSIEATRNGKPQLIATANDHALLAANWHRIVILVRLACIAGFNVFCTECELFGFCRFGMKRC